jgi:hypothetical protein
MLMSIVNRVIGIITAPNTEWQKIKTESSTLPSLLSGFILPLALVSAAANFIGQAFIGSSFFGVRVGGTINYGIYSAALILIQTMLSFYLTSYVIDFLAPNFQSQKNLDKSAQLVAYSSAPSLVGGILGIYPGLAMIGGLFGLYSLYLLFVGLPVLKETPEDKRIGYIIVSILLLLVIYVVIGSLLGLLLMPLFGISGLNSFNITS